MSRYDAVNQSIDGSFINPHRSMAAQSGYHDLSNMSMQSGEDVSFSVKASRQAFDFTFNNLAKPDQLIFSNLKEAFQCYLKKDEVIIKKNIIN
jgi:hypothetical protein